MSWVFDQSRASLGARLVLQSIANHADKRGGNAYPSIETIAEESHLSTRQVMRCIAQLEELGELAVYPRATTKLARARGKHNLYGMILMPGYEPPEGLAQRSPGDKMSPPEVVDHVTSASRPGDISDSDHVTNRAKTAEGTTSSEPSIRTVHEPPATFEQFWAAYPKRKGRERGRKDHALTAWKKLTTAERADVMTSLPHYAAGQDPEFIKDASGYLNGHLFEGWMTPATAKMTDAERFIAKVHAQEAAERAAAAPIAEIEEW